MDIDQFLLKAEQICRERGARLTELRKRVLELVARAGEPVGAYALLDMLKEDDNASRKAAPPTIYRALDFLLQHGLVHRIASHNTYIVCDHPGHRHAGLFFVCSNCGSVVELDSHKTDPRCIRNCSRTRL